MRLKKWLTLGAVVYLDLDPLDMQDRLRLARVDTSYPHARVESSIVFSSLVGSLKVYLCAQISGV